MEGAGSEVLRRVHPSPVALVNLLHLCFQERHRLVGAPVSLCKAVGSQLNITEEEASALISTLQCVVRAALLRGAIADAEATLLPLDLEKDLMRTMVEALTECLPGWKAVMENESLGTGRLMGDIRWDVDSIRWSSQLSKMGAGVPLIRLEIDSVGTDDVTTTTFATELSLQDLNALLSDLEDPKRLLESLS